MTFYVREKSLMLDVKKTLDFIFCQIGKGKESREKSITSI
jgi:hypothetical protein